MFVIELEKCFVNSKLMMHLALCILNFGCNQILFLIFLHASVIKRHYCELEKVKPSID
jgi:hypothetical protein